MNVQVTSVSSKGQVVIPSEIREQIGIIEGSQMMILTDGHNLLLKLIDPPRFDAFKNLVKASRALAKKRNLTKSDLSKAIRTARNANRH